MTFASLFCGIGGLDLGMKAAGFRPQGAIDDDELATDHYRRNILGPVVCAPLPEVWPRLLDDADLVVAGPPCQPFSLAGALKPDDQRANLLLVVLRAAQARSTRAIVVENVPHARAGHGGVLWASLHEGLRLNGYRSRDLILRGSEAGLPQTRKRVFLVATRDMDPPVGSAQPEDTSQCLRTLLDGVERVRDHVPERLDPSSVSAKIAARIGQGQQLSNVRGGDRNIHTWDIPEVFGEISDQERSALEAIRLLRRRSRVTSSGDGDPVSIARLDTHLGFRTAPLVRDLIQKQYLRERGDGIDFRSTFNGKFRRLAWKDQAPTVHTKMGQARYFLHPDEGRGFSAREAARMQGIPDEFEFVGRESDRLRLIGNAVPPPMALHVAGPIFSALDVRGAP